MSSVPSPSSESTGANIPSLWQNRNYLLLWGGQGVSAMGSQISRLAFPLLILSLTGSAAQAGITGGLNALPYVVLGLLAGALVDRWNRKLVMIVCDTGRTLLLGSIPLALWLGHFSLIQVYTVALLSGALDVFFDLAETASLPVIVSRELLPRAMAQNGATFSASSLISQPLGGVLFQIGRTIPFLADSISYAVSVVSLLFVHVPSPRREGRIDLHSVRADIAEGLRWLWNQRLIRFMAFFNAGGWIMFSGNYLVVIVLARHEHASPAVTGAILAMNGVGGIFGSLLGGRLQQRFGFRRVITGSVWAWVVLWPLYAVAPNPVALAAISGAIFTVFPLYNIVQMSYRLSLIPDELQGRVNSAFRLIAFSGQPVGVALAGALLQSVGDVSTVLVIAGWLLVLAITITLNRDVRAAT